MLLFAYEGILAFIGELHPRCCEMRNKLDDSFTCITLSALRAEQSLQREVPRGMPLLCIISYNCHQ